MKTSCPVALALLLAGSAAFLSTPALARKGNDDAQEHRCRHCDDSRHYDRKGRNGGDANEDRSGRRPEAGASASSRHQHRGRGRGRGRSGDSHD
jgi:hypothetical protein